MPCGYFAGGVIDRYSTGTHFCRRLPVSTSPVYKLPRESNLPTCTQWNSPVSRPGRPKVRTTAPSLRRTVSSTLLVPSISTKKFCFLSSGENARPQLEPEPLVLGSNTNCRTKLPSL